MKDLLYAIAAGLVEDKTAIQITEDEPDAEGVITLLLLLMTWEGLSVNKEGSLKLSVPLCVPVQLKKILKFLLLLNK